MISIVGCRHELQGYELEQIGEAQRVEMELKRRYYETLESLIVRNEVVWIGEECRPELKTIAKMLAEEHGCKFEVIDASEEERKNYGITQDYQKNKTTEHRGHSFAKTTWQDVFLQRWARRS
jgi:hypothetical protein